VSSRERVKDLLNILGFGGIDAELLQLFFDGLFLFSLPQSQLLKIEVETFVAARVLLLEDWGIFVLPLQMRGKIAEP